MYSATQEKMEDTYMVNIGNRWDEILKDEFQKDYYLKIREFLKYE